MYAAGSRALFAVQPQPDRASEPGGKTSALPSFIYVLCQCSNLVPSHLDRTRKVPEAIGDMRKKQETWDHVVLNKHEVLPTYASRILVILSC